MAKVGCPWPDGGWPGSSWELSSSNAGFMLAGVEGASLLRWLQTSAAAGIRVHLRASMFFIPVSWSEIVPRLSLFFLRLFCLLCLCWSPCSSASSYLHLGSTLPCSCSPGCMENSTPSLGRPAPKHHLLPKHNYFLSVMEKFKLGDFLFEGGHRLNLKVKRMRQCLQPE